MTPEQRTAARDTMAIWNADSPRSDDPDDVLIEKLRTTLGQMLTEFAASLNTGKPVGYTVGSMKRALAVIRDAEALLGK